VTERAFYLRRIYTNHMAGGHLGEGGSGKLDKRVAVLRMEKCKK